MTGRGRDVENPPPHGGGKHRKIPFRMSDEEASSPEPPAGEAKRTRLWSVASLRRKQTRQDRRTIGDAIFLSFVLHALVLAMQFEDAGFGIPGVKLPWQERRAAVPELRVVLVGSPSAVASGAAASASRAASSPAAAVVAVVAGAMTVETLPPPGASSLAPAAAPVAPAAEKISHRSRLPTTVRLNDPRRV